MQGDKPVAALLRAKVEPSDNVSMKLTVGMKSGYMILSEFENELGAMTAKVYPRESAAKASSSGQEIIKVNVIRDFT
jgi:hypothetical protein